MRRLWTRIAIASGAIILIGTLATAAYLNNRVDSLSATVSELTATNTTTRPPPASTENSTPTTRAWIAVDSEARDAPDDELLFTDEGPVLAQTAGRSSVDRTGDIVTVVVTSDRNGLLITYVSAAKINESDLYWSRDHAPGPGRLFDISWITMLESGGREWSIVTSNGFSLATSVTTPTGEKLEIDEAPFLNRYQRNRLHVPVPFSYLAGLEKPFRWDALTLWTIRGQDSPSDDLTYFDPIPQVGLPEPGKTGKTRNMVNVP